MWQNSSCGKTQIVTKLKVWEKNLRPKCDKTQSVTKLRVWQNSECDKTQSVTKLENSNYDKTQKLKLWQNLKKKIKLGRKLKYDKSHFMKTKKKFKWFLERPFWHLDNLWDFLWAAFCDSRNVFLDVFLRCLPGCLPECLPRCFPGLSSWAVFLKASRTRTGQVLIPYGKIEAGEWPRTIFPVSVFTRSRDNLRLWFKILERLKIWKWKCIERNLNY